MQQIDFKRGNVRETVILWDSVNEPAAHIATRKWAKEENQRFGGRYLSDAETGRYPASDNHADWLGAPSLKELTNRLTNGWSDGVDRLMKLAVAELEMTSIRRRRVRGDQGDEIDMQAVWRGDLSRAWTRTRRQQRTGGTRNVTLICDVAGNCGMGADVMFWRGAAVLRVAEALTEAGYNVGIYAGAATKNIDAKGKCNACQLVEIKATDAPLDLSSLAALTCMPGYFRTSLFAGIVAAADHFGEEADYSLGRMDEDGLKRGAKKLGMDNVFIQPAVNSQQAAKEWIDQIVAAIQAPAAAEEL